MRRLLLGFLLLAAFATGVAVGCYDGTAPPVLDDMGMGGDDLAPAVGDGGVRG